MVFKKMDFCSSHYPLEADYYPSRRGGFSLTSFWDGTFNQNGVTPELTPTRQRKWPQKEQNPIKREKIALHFVHLTTSTSSSIYSELGGTTMASMRTSSTVSPALMCDALLDLNHINFWTAGMKFWILTMEIQEYSLYRKGNETLDRYLSLFSIFKNWCVSVWKMRLKLKDSYTGAKPHKKHHVTLCCKRECLFKICFSGYKGFNRILPQCFSLIQNKMGHYPWRFNGLAVTLLSIIVLLHYSFGALTLFS